MTRGAGWFSPPKALVRKRSAAAASRLAERRKSIVAPVESTARYKYTHLPFTRTYVSSTLQESFVVLSRLRRRRSNSGACRWTQAPDGDVIHREPTLGQKLLDVAVRKREAQIPADRQENDLRFKLAPLEQAANRRVQKEHPTSLSRQACKVATLPMGGRDENAAGDIAALLNEFEKLAVHTGAAVIYSAHYSKGNQAN